MNPEDFCVVCMAVKRMGAPCPVCGTPDKVQYPLMHLAPRTELAGKYLIGAALGQGGFGITYIAWDLNLEQKLAIKEYYPRDIASRSSDRKTVKPLTEKLRDPYRFGMSKFIREGRILAKFREHPNIVSQLDFFKANETAYIVMRYIEGTTLRDHLTRVGGSLPLDTALAIVTPVMDALRAVHKEGLLHRDISPDNIFITVPGDGHGSLVKILDFGSSKFAMGEHSHSLQITHKAGYTPEEQYRTEGNQGPWTDVYALGATLYHLITGKRPPEALERMAHDEIEPPSKYAPDLTSSREAALLKALAVYARDRFQTIDEFQSALVSGNWVPGPSAAPVTSGKRPATKGSDWAPRRRLLETPLQRLAALAMLLIVLIGAGLLASRRGGGEPAQAASYRVSDPGRADKIAPAPDVSVPPTQQTQAVTEGPSIVAIEPTYGLPLITSGERQNLLIRGRGFPGGLTAEIVGPGQHRQPLKPVGATQTAFHASVALSEVGRYELKIWDSSSPPKLLAIRNFNVGTKESPPPPPAPSISVISPASTESSPVPREFRVIGSDFQPGVGVRVRVPGGSLTPVYANVLSATELLFTFPVREVGTYQVQVGDSDSPSKAFVVTAAVAAPLPPPPPPPVTSKPKGLGPKGPNYIPNNCLITTLTINSPVQADLTRDCTMGQVVHDAASDSYVKLYDFTMNEKNTVTLNLDTAGTPRRFSPMLLLYDGEYNSVRKGTVDGFNAQLLITLEPGKYVVMVTSELKTGGTYKLKLAGN